jgi:hypothetical protein
MIIVSEAHINDRWKLSSGLWKSIITRAARASIWISQGADRISAASGTESSPRYRS